MLVINNNEKKENGMEKPIYLKSLTIVMMVLVL